MHSKLHFLGTALLLIFLSACDSRRQEHGAEFYVFGTMVEVVTRDASQKQAHQAFTDIQVLLQSLHNGLHAWEPGPLTQLNDAFEQGKAAPVSSDIDTLIRMSRDMELRSEGRFNAASGALIRMWGFHTSQYPVTTPIPGSDALQAVLSLEPSASDIQIEDGQARSPNPSVQLDFGGIAKGYAVDRVVTILAEHEIHNFIINAGGDLRAAGGNPQRPWRVGITGPDGLLGGIEIQGNEAVFTSGVSQRFAQHGSERYPHIIDPRSGMPVSGFSSVTVISREGWFADACATALMVAGPDEWAKLASELGLESVLVVTSDGAVQATPQMQARLISPTELMGQLTVVEIPPGESKKP